MTLASKKAQALLARLALRPGRTQPRDALTALLWADTDDRQARHSLRQTLLDLRKALGAGKRALIDGDQLGLDPSVIDVDVAAFEQLVAQGTPESLEGAAALYQGELLEGFTLREAAFEEWLQAQRERLRESALEAMARLLSLQTEGGATEPAIRTAVRLLALDPLQEGVHRMLMRLYARQGRRAGALRQYQVCVSVLQRELGVEPEPATKAVYQEILRDQQARAVVPRSPERAQSRSRRRPSPPRADPRSPETPLIGREGEIAQLRSALRDAWARSGAGATVLLTGEAGIGKSRLVEELRAEGARQNGRVMLGRFHESEQILPLRAWVDAFREGGVVSDVEALEGFDPVWQAELVRLLPELGEPGTQLPTTSESYVRLFETVAELVSHLARRRPVLLILEDLHWADEMSLRLLSFLGRRIQGHRVLVVGTVREEEMALAPMLRRLLEELDREGQLSRLALSPLSPDHTVGLVRALGRTGSTDARVAEIGEQAWAASEGNPFVIVEIMRALQQGRLPEDARAVPLPQRVREVITGRLERLGDTSRELAAVAAIIGREFGFDLLQRAVGLDQRETAAGVEELVRRRVFDAVGERFDFTHDRVRAVVYGNLLAPRRLALHGAVGAALEALHAERLEDVY
ncbi:MAG TPA: AAA family ATPase, partial [Longimicrobiales bacterium]|nr:AAA family ATPase [Longimicrobiales bacterium]